LGEKFPAGFPFGRLAVFYIFASEKTPGFSYGDESERRGITQESPAFRHGEWSTDRFSIILQKGLH
jgi:hypothetical protein